MKNKRLPVIRFISTFFLIFGVIQFAFLLRSAIPFRGWFGDINRYNSCVSMISALVFTISHAVISSETLDLKISVRKRMVLCAIPCAGVCAILVMSFGLQNWTRDFFANKTAAIIVWDIAFIISLIVLLWICYLIERHSLAEGKRYDEVLKAYKNNRNDTD